MKQMIEYFKGFNEGDNITTTCDFIMNIEELIEENQSLKKQLEELKSTNKVLSEELTKDKILKQDCLTTCCGIPIGDIPKLINQQKEFIEYITKTIEELECEDVDDEEMKGYLIQRIDTFKEILSKYKEIIHFPDNGKKAGGKDDNK